MFLPCVACAFVSQRHVGSVPAEPSRSWERREEEMFLAGPVPGSGYCGISRADVGCYFKGIHVHECTGEREASESALGHRASAGSPFPFQNVNLILGGQRSLPLVQLSAKKKRMSFEKEAPLLFVTSLNSLATFQNRAPSWCCRRSPAPLQCEAQRRNSSTHWCWFSASSAPMSWSLSNPCGDVPSRALCDQT